MGAMLKLLNSYYLKGFFGPFFVFVFPILLLFIMSNAMEAVAQSQAATGGLPAIKYMSNIVGGIMITSLLSNGLFGMPITIIEFKKSTLMKRIGAAHISKRKFFVAIIIYQFAWSVLSVIWTLLWAGIIIGTKYQYNWSVAFNANFGIALPFMIVAVLVAVAIGLLIVSFINTQQGVTAVSNVIYLPISFLSGSFLPKAQIDQSPVLNGISYVLPTKYGVDPFFAAFINGKSGLDGLNWEAWGFPLIGIAFVAVSVIIAAKKFRWS